MAMTATAGSGFVAGPLATAADSHPPSVTATAVTYARSAGRLDPACLPCPGQESGRGFQGRAGPHEAMRDTEEYPGADRGHGRDHPVARVMVVDHLGQDEHGPGMTNGQNADRCR